MPYHITYSTCPLLKRKKRHTPFQKKLFFGRAREYGKSYLPGCRALHPCISCGVPLRRPKISYFYNIIKNAILFPLCFLAGLLYRILVNPQYGKTLGFSLPFVITILFGFLLMLYGKWEPVMTDSENTTEGKEMVFLRENERAAHESKIERRALLFFGLPLSVIIVVIGFLAHRG